MNNQTLTIETPYKKKKKNTDNHYVTNAVFLEKILDYKKAIKQAEKENKLKPQIPDDLARILILICEGMSMRYNFKNYSFREDMVCNALLICVKFIGNFDPKKSVNPFGFFSSCAFRSMVNTIKSEKKQFSLRFAAISK